MRVIGITGGVGSGKSAVLDYMEDTFDAFICKADEVAMELQKKGGICYRQIVQHFGDEVIGLNGELNRAYIAEIVFSDERELKQLNKIVHPAVKEAIYTQIREQRDHHRKVFVLEAALLLEENYQEICDELWYIYTDLSVRRKRLKFSRGYDDHKIDGILATQKSEEEFKAACDITINNSADFEHTKIQIDRIMEK